MASELRLSGADQDDRNHGVQAELDRQVISLAEDEVQLDQRQKALRHQLAHTARKLAAVEDEMARVHEDIAAQRPDKAVVSRQAAEQARAAAQRARDIADNYSPS
jgi:predicted  nucleic acid-binding Zn-ribbon protein